MREVAAHMETMGEKHAFFEKRKCGSRKVLHFMRSLLYALTVLSLPLRGAWIEISTVSMMSVTGTSLPLRGAWIEIYKVNRYFSFVYKVAPPAGSVD